MLKQYYPVRFKQSREVKFSKAKNIIIVFR